MNYYIDLDSTLYPLATAIKQHPSYKYLNPNKINTWEYLIEYTNPEIFQEALNIAFKHHTNIQPIPKSPEALNYLKLLTKIEPGEIIILTNREPEYEPDSTAWLKKNEIPHHKIIHIGENNSKIEYINNDTNQESILIDDAPHILKEAKQHPLIHPLGLAYPYNQEHTDITENSWVLILDRITRIQETHKNLS